MNRLLLLFSLLISQICFSQIIVKGKISDKLTKEELIGANVVWKTQNIGVSTDFNGKFEIQETDKHKLILSWRKGRGYCKLEVNFWKKEGRIEFWDLNEGETKEIFL